MSDSRPLAGTRLVSLAQNVPGPLAVARLAAEGAAATKIEPPAGDPLRAYCPSWYDELHRGIAIERLDLKADDGRARLAALLTDAALLITSQRPSALARLSLDPSTLARTCPHLRVLRIVGEVAEPETPGHDLTYQAGVGLVGDGLPLTLTADVLASERAVAAALLLLREPRGTVRDVGIHDSLDALVAPRRHGLTTPGSLLGGGLSAYGVYAARSGHVAVAALEPHFRARLFESLDVAPDADLAPVFRERTASEWVAWARERDLPIVEVRRTTPAR